MVVGRGNRESREVDVGKERMDGDGERLDFVWWVHNAMCRQSFVELYT